MILKIKLLNKAEKSTINKRIYEKESYIKSIKEYVENLSPIYKFNPLHHGDNISFESATTSDPCDLIGKAIGFDEENYIIETDISDKYYEKIKDTIDSYYIMIRSMGIVIDHSENNNPIFKIEKILAMDLNNDPDLIIK